MNIWSQLKRLSYHYTLSIFEGLSCKLCVGQYIVTFSRGLCQRPLFLLKIEQVKSSFLPISDIATDVNSCYGLAFAEHKVKERHIDNQSRDALNSVYQ